MGRMIFGYYTPNLFFHTLSLSSNGLPPAAHGLTNVTDSAYTGDTAVADPSGCLFWDTVHPTTKGHALIAQAAYALDPEPATTMLFIFSTATMPLCR